METVLFLIAHNDDQLIGAGGTMAKYAKEGKRIVTVIFPFGESSYPFEQDFFTRKKRVIESKRASKLLGETELYYLGLKETKFKEEIPEKKIDEKIGNVIKRIKPAKIFTHSMDDPHPDHRAVYEFTMYLTNKLSYKGSVYSFNIWNFFFNFRHRDLPKLVVDITSTFGMKLEAFKNHKSQWVTKLTQVLNIYIQAMLH